jgi:hypothetical protein
MEVSVNWVRISVLSLIVFGFILAFASAEEQARGSQEMVLKGGETGNIPFPHGAHQQALKDCSICHSLFPQQTGGIATRITEGTLKNKQVMNELCTRCHRQMKQEGKSTGPTSCRECHKIK